VCHHALAVLQYFVGMTVGGAATDMGHAQIAGIDKAHELGRLMIEQRIAADRIGRRPPGVGEARRNVSLILEATGRVPAVSLGSAEPDGFFVMRIMSALMAARASR